MDLNTVSSVARPRTRAELASCRDGDAWLAGGTWLFSEPQPTVRRLVDILDLGWMPVRHSDDVLSEAATCPVAELESLETLPEWRAGFLIGECCRAFLASHKIRSVATVGGNICLALPAGPMISLAAALDALCVVWMPDGTERLVDVVDFILGPRRTILQPGEILRSVEFPLSSLRRRASFRKTSLTPLGRSAALLIGTHDEKGDFTLTVTASTRRPVRLRFDALPGGNELREALEAAIPFGDYYDDVHGHPEWRRHLTLELGGEILLELAGAAP